jgi:hypothetical protein
MRRPVLPLLAVLAITAALPGCAGRMSTATIAAVPDSSGRLSYELPADDAERAGAIGRALDGAVCLLRTGSAHECRRESPAACNTRTDSAAMREMLRPAMERIGSLQLRSAFTVDTAITSHVQGATPATVLLDARRATPCRDWGGGACAAFRYGGLWWLATAPPPPFGRSTRADRVTLFPADPVCRADPRRGAGG